MADAVPNYDISQQRLVAEIASLQANHARQRLEIMEMADRVRKHRENMDATVKAIETKETELRSLVSAHGALDEARFQRLCDGLGGEG